MLGVGKKTVQPDEELDDLRGLIAGEDADETPIKKTDRRGILKLAGGALLGAVGAIPAAAASGDYMVTGCTNIETTTTNVLGPATDAQDALAGRGGVGIHGDGNASTTTGEIGVLGTSKSGAGIGVRGSVSGGLGVEGIATTGTAGRFHTNSLSATGYDVQLGTVNPLTGSGRLGMVGRGDVGATSPSWNPSFFITNSLTGAANFQHELVRGGDGSIWAS